MQDNINYQELVASYNKVCNTKRTEDIYKVRSIKVATDNNISLKANNNWTEKEKIYIINKVQRNPFDINWTKMSENLKRSESSIKAMYNDIVSAEEHMDCCLLNLEVDYIHKVIDSIKHNCSDCKVTMYSNPRMWQGLEYCDECYYKEYNEKVIKLWEQVREYSVKTNKNYCNLCSKKATFDNTLTNRFHYDHIDLFNKTTSICKLVREGVNIDDITQEIDNCQLLCISCHSMVTKVETLCGFTRIKRRMIKEFNKTEDEEKRDKLISEYSELYKYFMTIAYNSQ
jgi:hypothetical protein